MASPYRLPLDDRDALAFEISESRGRDVPPRRATRTSRFSIGLRKEQRPLARGVLPRRGAAVELAAEQRRRELRGVDNRRTGFDPDAAEACLDEVERKARLPGSLVNGDQAVDTRRSSVVCADTASDAAASESTSAIAASQWPLRRPRTVKQRMT